MLSQRDTTAFLWYVAFIISFAICSGIIYAYFLSPTAMKQAQEEATDQQQRVVIPIPQPALPIEQELSSKSPPPVFTTEQHPTYINIIITDLGIHPLATQYALQFPNEVTLGFSPHAFDLETWVKQASGSQHDILLTLPASEAPLPLNASSPYTLSPDISAERNIEQLQRILALTKQKLGIYAPDNQLISSREELRPLLEAAKDANLVWIHNKESLEDTTTKQIADELGVTHFSPDGIIGQSLDPKHIRKTLSALEIHSKQHGHAIAVIRPNPISLRLLEEWISTLASKNISLISLPSLKERLQHAPSS